MQQMELTPADAPKTPPAGTQAREMASCRGCRCNLPAGRSICVPCWDAERIEHMPKRVKRASIDERFADFLRDHADVVNAVVVVSRDMKRAGYERYSVKAAWEVVRWQSRTSAHVAAALYQGGEPALNNSMTAPLARHIMAICPDLADFFETRKRKGEL